MNKKQTILSSWIYGKEDYQQMFALTEDDLNKRILDYPGNLSTFNAQMYHDGFSVVSGDVAYDSQPDDIQPYIDEVFKLHVGDLKSLTNRLKDPSESNFNAIVDTWTVRKEMFEKDYSAGYQQQRYRSMQLPTLPFPDHHFELLLCSDLVFHTKLLESNSVTDCVSELCRVAEEVRIFPLLNQAGEISAALGPVMLYLQQKNFGVEVRQVAFEKIKGGNAMLRIWAKECHIER